MPLDASQDHHPSAAAGARNKNTSSTHFISSDQPLLISRLRISPDYVLNILDVLNHHREFNAHLNLSEVLRTSWTPPILEHKP